MPENTDHIRRILEELEAGGELSQRGLAARLGIALGRVNQLLRTLMQRQWVRGSRGSGRRIRYLVTPEGSRARAHMSREHLGRALATYSAVCDRVRDGLAACGAPDGDTRPRALALYGMGAEAQIVFACAAELGVPLIGFIDDSPRDSYMGLPVLPPVRLTSMSFNGRTFDWLVVPPLTDHDVVRARLERIGFPLERVRWL